MGNDVIPGCTLWTDIAEEDLSRFVLQLGYPVSDRRGGPFLQELEVQSRSEARPRSLSAAYGAGALPLHTDGAAHRRPPSYTLLYCRNAGADPVATNVLPFGRLELSKADRRVLSSVPWAINGGPGRRFLRPVIEGDRVRYDPVCMRPPNSGRPTALRLTAALADAKPTAVPLHPGQALLIDNGLVLHGRADATNVGGKRLLLRVLISSEELT